ncbi:cobaltochelatase subunit CobN [Kiloniella laminariae]|uniref:Cobaltochelatase subunit CobN n=1 Tax=Kiloniella laminariae TaxID=454162 RepID=A0ABT4LHZ9_9PROT|nr:cobaltochelatase subunit CobN [Kiloniella laminariae]MCZ4280732.1 cobaltochelatase subunit CobN [Kiloniella laminariae]
MHLLQAQPGMIADGSEAVDLGQSPGDILILSAADTELASLVQARQLLGEAYPSLRLANLMQLSHNMSVDLYVEDMVAEAKFVVARILGGIGYWPYGVEQLRSVCKQKNIPLVLLPGDDQPDAELAAYSTVPQETYHRIWQYFIHGGPDNARNSLCYLASLSGAACEWVEPKPLLRAGVYWPGLDTPDIDDLKEQWIEGAPVAAIVFYRALLQAANLTPVDALVQALRDKGVNPMPIYCSSLKEPLSAGIVSNYLSGAGTGIILNATGFAISTPGAERKETPFDVVDCPILQVIFSGGNEAGWRDGLSGLSARDIAMNVALPEVDGRILSRAVSFKSEARFDALTECSVVSYQEVPDRIVFVAELAANWLRLRNCEPAGRRVALIMANYPNRDGRMGNGVGLDTPAGTIELLKAMAGAGYDVTDIPANGNALVERMAEGPTNAAVDGRIIRETLSLPAYQAFWQSLPEAVREAVESRWGGPEKDPFFMPEQSAFAVSAFHCGKIIVGLQPARGYNINPVETYHSPDLVPPHGYLAFYAWLRQQEQVHAIVHMGKHGNMEWLPGKSLALSKECFPEVVFGAMPHLYPFIVNDPGEGTQAKRRAQAVIIDHLTPPLARAESYGPLADLEQLCDEYYEAAGVDPRRLKLLRDEILKLTQRIGLDKDCGISEQDDEDAALSKLDNYLCELKEMQIRDGLHIFGQSPDGRLLHDLLVALTRLPRGDGKGGDASLIRALARDLGFPIEFDPLDCRFGDIWEGPKPEVLQAEGSWRTKGDTVERLEILAVKLVSGAADVPEDWQATKAVVAKIKAHLDPIVRSCGASEIEGALRGLNGQFVEPGPSGAPTRGKPDVLPTGRNFYSVDSRVVPTPAAWQLGWKSANLMIERYRQENGSWPKRMVLSAWGTSNMRTGGDDIAQGLALMGVQPQWEPTSRRVIGFEILPLSVLDRPRVDVTLRVSGFFRDAFPAQIDLFDSAARAVAALDEPEKMNPLAARVSSEKAELMARGLDEKSAAQRSGYRVFGSKPGAYGAGLQALIDERGWESDADLARAYVAWGGYAYGSGGNGEAGHSLFENRLRDVEAVVHNQDNREHDLLDSDDYYQFEGGVTAAIRHLSGAQPVVYHNDHSRPESPQIRTLQEEIARVVRARVVNPKWIEGVMRHGYKGAFEMAATVDYLFAFAATAKVVEDHHFDAVFDAYLMDGTVREFLEQNNAAALKEMAERLIEAQDRNLWKAKSNSARALLEQLAAR